MRAAARDHGELSTDLLAFAASTGHAQLGVDLGIGVGVGLAPL